MLEFLADSQSCIAQDDPDGLDFYSRSCFCVQLRPPPQWPLFTLACYVQAPCHPSPQVQSSHSGSAVATSESECHVFWFGLVTLIHQLYNQVSSKVLCRYPMLLWILNRMTGLLSLSLQAVMIASGLICMSAAEEALALRTPGTCEKIMHVVWRYYATSHSECYSKNAPILTVNFTYYV